MIDLLARERRSALGISAILDVERVAHRWISHACDARGPLVLLAGEEPDHGALGTVAGGLTTLVIGGEPPPGMRAAGARAQLRETALVTIPLAQPLLPASVVSLCERFAIHDLRIPRARTCITDPAPSTETLARYTLAESEARTHPLVVRCGTSFWCPVDLGHAFAGLLEDEGSPPSTGSPWWRAALETGYYAAPEALRRFVRRRAYARLERTIGTHSSRYPVDATGYLLIELTMRLVELASGALVRVGRWPRPFRAAATVTHDLEPRAFAYRQGLDDLLDVVDRESYPASFGVVARSADRQLTSARSARLTQHGIMCHGLSHRGERLHHRDLVLSDLCQARARVERRLGRPCRGYRSPRLDRSPQLLWALDRSGFEYDSSYPDVDRENPHHYGGGVRLNVPCRPLVEQDDGTLRPSRCLELPLTAPDCVQPIFAGATSEELTAAVSSKAEFLRESGGLFVALVHAGVFGVEDARQRMRHLDFVLRALRRRDVWLAGIEEIAAWWKRREAVELEVDGSLCTVTYRGTAPIAGLQLKLQAGNAERAYELPELRPGARCSIDLTVP